MQEWWWNDAGCFFIAQETFRPVRISILESIGNFSLQFEKNRTSAGLDLWTSRFKSKRHTRLCCSLESEKHYLFRGVLNKVLMNKMNNNIPMKLYVNWIPIESSIQRIKFLITGRWSALKCLRNGPPPDFELSRNVNFYIHIKPRVHKDQEYDHFKTAKNSKCKN